MYRLKNTKVAMRGMAGPGGRCRGAAEVNRIILTDASGVSDGSSEAVHEQ